jgi:hypothetical protein
MDIYIKRHYSKWFIKLKSYTVATLPTGAGSNSLCNRCNSTNLLRVLTGGGSVKVPVFYNGTALAISH